MEPSKEVELLKAMKGPHLEEREGYFTTNEQRDEDERGFINT